MKQFYKILSSVHPALKLIISCFCFLLFIGNYSLLIETGNWYQQFMPNLNGRSVTDVFFLDSLTGWAVTNATNQNPDTTFVLKTTSSGDNWVIQYQKLQIGGGFPGYNKIFFLNQNTGFVCGVQGFDKSINGGTSWTTLNSSDSYQDMSIVNENTIWIVSSNPLTGGVFRTTTGGASWTPQLNLGSQNPTNIYFYNASTGYISNNTGAPYVRRTTDSGSSWTVNVSGEGFTDMYFIDSLTGWRAYGTMKKTTNGGLNWVNQTLPSGGNIALSQITRFANINKDTIFGVGGIYITPNGLRGIVYRTTNTGDNWLFQVPDTAINIGVYRFVKFYNKLIGWAYSNGPGIHTTNGADTEWLVGIKKISNNEPKDYKLFQNYPNPFNPLSKIIYQIGKSKFINLIVYDITGKQIIDLVNRKQSAGTYEVNFAGYGLSSGVYFYSLIVDNKVIDTRKMILVK